MAKLKTRPSEASVEEFLARVEDDTRRAGCRTLVAMMERATGAAPVMWGPTIVGFGSYHYRYDSGRGGDWMLTGFSPRKRNLTIYVLTGFTGSVDTLSCLGPHRRSSGSCLYVKRLADIDLGALEELIRASVDRLRQTYPTEPPARLLGGAAPHRSSPSPAE